jgi:hypothetical protein
LHRQIIPSKIHHADGGNPGCPANCTAGSLKTGGIICDECFSVIRMVNPLMLQGLLDEMERRRDSVAATHIAARGVIRSIALFTVPI